MAWPEAGWLVMVLGMTGSGNAEFWAWLKRRPLDKVVVINKKIDTALNDCIFYCILEMLLNLYFYGFYLKSLV